MVNYEVALREHFQRTESRRVEWDYIAEVGGLYEGIVPRGFVMPTRETLDTLWTTLEQERANKETARAQRKADRDELLGQKADAAIQAIGDDLIALAAAGSLAAVKPLVENLLRRQRAIIRAMKYFEDLG